MKIWLTKYKNVNSLNYLNNEYVLNDLSNGINFQSTLKLFDIPSSYTKLYYTFSSFYDSTNHIVNLSIYLYSDSAMSNEVAYGTHYLTYSNYTSYSYYWFKLNIAGFNTNINGYIILNLTNIFNELNTIYTGYIDCKQVIDYFEETKLLPDYVSGLDEQHVNGFDLSYSVSDIDLKMCNYTGTLSNLGKTLFEFLKDVDETNYIRVAILSEDGTPDILRVGIMDYKSIKYDYNEKENHNTATFKVYMMERDLSQGNRSATVFETILKNSMFSENWADNFTSFMNRIAYNFGCDFNDSISFDAYYNTQAGSSIILNYEFLNQNKDQNLWEWFKEICKCGGILFKVYFNTLNINGFDKPVLKLFYPNENNTSVTIAGRIEEERGNKGFNYDTVYMVHNGQSIFHLFLQDITTCTSRKLLYKVEDNYYSFNDGIKLDSGQMYGINLKMYYETLSGITEAFVAAATFAENSTSNDRNWIVAFTLFQNRYKHILYNFAETITLKVPYTNIFEIDLYNKFTYDSKDWFIEKMFDIDYEDETLKLNAVEIPV